MVLTADCSILRSEHGRGRGQKPKTGPHLTMQFRDHSSLLSTLLSGKPGSSFVFLHVRGTVNRSPHALPCTSPFLGIKMPS